MSITLYNIAADFNLINNELTDNGGELTPEIEARLTELNHSIEIKGFNIAGLIFSKNDNLTAIDTQIARLTDLRKTESNAIENLKKYLLNNMQFAGITEIKLPTLKISLRPSKSIEIVDESLLPPGAFIVVPESRKVSKIQIKELLKTGECEGAKEVTNYSIQFK